MTSKEIKAAIERLRKISYGARSYNAIEAVEAAIPDGSWVDGLIELLTQADPDTHVELPKDAEGRHIHVGDDIERGSTHGKVIALMLSNYPKKWGGGLHWAVQREGEKAPTALDNCFYHYHKPTVEDVLTEYAKEVRSEFLDLRIERITSEYAAKLRELMDEVES